MSVRALAAALSLSFAFSAAAQWQTTTNTPSGLWHSGPIGIGLSDPNYPFEVSGTIYQRGSSGGVNAYSFLSRRSGGVAGYPDISGVSGGLVLADVAAANTQLVMTQYAAYFLGTSVLGIGTSSPQANLDIVRPAYATLRVFANHATNAAVLTLRTGDGTSSGKVAVVRYETAEPGAAYWDVGIRGTNNNYQIFDGNAVAARLVVDAQGRVGMGTTSPADRLHIESASTSMRLTHTDATSTLNMIGFYEGANLWGFINQRGSTHASEPGRFNIGNSAVTGITSLWAGGNERVTVLANGNVGIGNNNPAAKLVVSGNLVATGSITGAQVINAVFQDLAEWVPATTDMTPGTVVVLNPARANEVMVSGRAYDTSVAGVVSAQPGILLGVAGEEKEQIATTGRVRVRVDATKGAVKIGDLLVTSGKPGMAMRSEPMEINGRAFHQPGTIIGKALEDLAGGEGEILVLLSLQ
jgi:hypothetical protein